MADEAKIKINGTLIPTPSEISVEINDLDSDSVRPVSTGILRRNRIRSNMLKIHRCNEYSEGTHSGRVHGRTLHS